MNFMYIFCFLLTSLSNFVLCSNLALTFDANNSTCTAACTACPEKTADTQADDQLIPQILNNTLSNTEAIQQILQQVNKIASTLSHVKNTTTTNSGAINDILLLVEELVDIHNESTPASSPLPTSCQEIKQRMPNSPSGVYLIVDENAANTQYVYCHMEELCGSDEGWTRLAYLDMTDASEECPSGFRLYESGGVRACGRPVSSVGSCVSVKFPSNGISYSEVCGRVVGYAYTSPDAVDRFIGGQSHHNDINSYYVDGVSITHGTPRKHIWTLMAGVSENNDYNGRFTCPCQQGSQQSAHLQSFIGNDYLCESGNPISQTSVVLYTSDPLWDGQQCGPLEQPCCNATGLPWFNKVLSSNSTDDIELRICGDESTTNEDVPISLYEMYVKH